MAFLGVVILQSINGIHNYRKARSEAQVQVMFRLTQTARDLSWLVAFSTRSQLKKRLLWLLIHWGRFVLSETQSRRSVLNSINPANTCPFIRDGRAGHDTIQYSTWKQTLQVGERLLVSQWEKSALTGIYYGSSFYIPRLLTLFRNFYTSVQLFKELLKVEIVVTSILHVTSVVQMEMVLERSDGPGNMSWNSWKLSWNMEDSAFTTVEYKVTCSSFFCCNNNDVIMHSWNSIYICCHVKLAMHTTLLGHSDTVITQRSKNDVFLFQTGNTLS